MPVLPFDPLHERRLFLFQHLIQKSPRPNLRSISYNLTPGSAESDTCISVFNEHLLLLLLLNFLQEMLFYQAWYVCASWTHALVHSTPLFGHVLCKCLCMSVKEKTENVQYPNYNADATTLYSLMAQPQKCYMCFPIPDPSFTEV